MRKSDEKKIERKTLVKDYLALQKISVVEVKPPSRIFATKERFDIFLAGSIENGKAKEWQKAMHKELNKMNPRMNVALFNPRRENWDPKWNQHNNPKLIEQIKWEIEHLKKANLIVMFLQPGTISPVSLLELGLFHKKKMIVYCPKGFHRKANVDVVCELFKIDVAKSWKEFVALTKEKIKEYHNKNNK